MKNSNNTKKERTPNAQPEQSNSHYTKSMEKSTSQCYSCPLYASVILCS